MNTMGDYNSCSSTKSSWALSSEEMKGRNSAEISRDYKNFLENDIDFNEQIDFDFRSKQQDIFAHDLGYEASEIMQPERKLLSSSLEITNMNDNSFRHSQSYGQRQNYLGEIFSCAVFSS